jgi:peptidoglycan/LPS O-acetylase OafA/YrhL
MYIKSLDGVRGIAVLLVMLFHLGYAPFGWIGVQIFFVLSGYLITAILLDMKHLPLTAYLGRFYWRRSLRIFPLYTVVLFVSAMVYFFWDAPRDFLNDLPYLATYTTNFGRLRQSDIDPAFVHLWSLAVEEQFYLIWPLLIYSIPNRSLKAVVVGIILIAPTWRLATYFYFMDTPELVGRAIYGLPFSQFDAFALGAAIVLWDLRQLNNAGKLFVVAAVMAALAGAIVILHQHFLGPGAIKWSFGYAMYLLPLYEFVWGYSILDIVSMIGIICAIQRLEASRFLENFAIVYLGRISYGVYVLHVPILVVITSSAATGPIFFMVYGTIVVTVSAASYRWLEKPFLNLKDRNVLRPASTGGRL